MGSDLGNVLTVWVKLQGKFPAACRQIRLDIVRCIISNVERLGQFAELVQSATCMLLLCAVKSASCASRSSSGLLSRHLLYCIPVCACNMVE